MPIYPNPAISSVQLGHVLSRFSVTDAPMPLQERMFSLRKDLRKAEDWILARRKKSQAGQTMYVAKEP